MLRNSFYPTLFIVITILNLNRIVDCQCQNFYTINLGDSCDNIAAAFRTTTSTLQLLNPSLNCASTLNTGSQICVPFVNNNIISTTPSSQIINTATCSTNIFYTIFSGDICENIAGAFKTNIATLLQLNPGLNCAALNVGQRICVPSSSSFGGNFQPIQTVCANNVYTVFSGDTCDNIAGAFRTTTAFLSQLNPGLNCAGLIVGQRLCVPSVSNNNNNNVNPSQTTCSTGNFYTVFSGDTCDNIAGAFRTSSQFLIQLNPGLNCAALQVGSRLCVPTVNNNIATTVSPFAGSCQNFYTIFSGDTCTNIAGAFRTTIAFLQQLNPSLNCVSLPIGQRICVPAVNNNIVTTISPFVNTCQNFYTIFSGDTCTNIAGAFRTTIASLQQLNPGLNCVSLPVGQRICVPAVNGLTTASPTPFPTTQCTTNNFYLVQSTDTCTSISGIFSLTTFNLQQLNPGLNCLALPVNQRICVPPLNLATTVSPVSCQNTYTIFSGDTCANIAGAFRTTLAGLQQLNPSLNCASLQIGQKICVPSVSIVTTISPTVACSTGNTYVINSFDSCTSIGTQFGTTGIIIQQLNSNLNCFSLPLPAGQRICVPSTSSIQTTCSTGNFYTLFSGDTCENIAGAFRTTVSILQQLNRGLNCVSLPFGQKICVPSVNNNIATTLSPFSNTCQNFYTIFSGDTCANIAGAFRTTVAGLQQLNPSLNCASLPIGARICVPSVNNNIINPQSACITGFFYTIFSGDTCTNIAGAFRSTLANLQQLNPNLNCAALTPGQRICVPRIIKKRSTKDIAVPAVFIPSSNGGCSNFFGITSGDTCDTIANILKTSVTSLLIANPTLNCDKLVTGSAICVPSLSQNNNNNNPSTNNIQPCLNSYQIQYGDICFDIAIRAQISLGEFLKLNPTVNCDLLRLGEQVCVAASTNVGRKQCGFVTNYVVQRGDTCFALALRYRLDLRLFTQALDCNHLQIGQQICI